MWTWILAFTMSKNSVFDRFWLSFPKNLALSCTSPKLVPNTKLSIYKKASGLNPRKLHDTPFYRYPTKYGHAPFISFFRTFPLLTTLFWNTASKKYWIDRKINSCGKVIFSCLEDYKTTLHHCTKNEVFHWGFLQ